MSGLAVRHALRVLLRANGTRVSMWAARVCGEGLTAAFPQAFVAHTTAASPEAPSLTSSPLGKLKRRKVTMPATTSAVITSDFSLPEARNHAKRSVAPDSRLLSLESSYPSMFRECAHCGKEIPES
eukprot:CAMPEP_0119089680 /NCGR_PEP_ID=MMETSP1178-20130426/149770_1 /TAXON_ID=33656 /ORGANISM="unid sp, Strain CCMP2000" /LENGTH=125 /DNA_ID=CAMNT_0007073049 /DNA_START=338 /DNA_END=713 /DNA_ORIENTATION=-